MASDGLIARLAERGISAAAEALFPENDLGAPDWRGTELVRRTWEWIDDLPAAQRRLLIALFVATELLGGLCALRLRFFSGLASEAREQAVRDWRLSDVRLLRILGDSLKASLTMMYGSHPDVIAYIGEHRSCEHPGDTLEIPVRPGALARMQVPE